jgi:hypothetical protein
MFFLNLYFIKYKFKNDYIPIINGDITNVIKNYFI